MVRRNGALPRTRTSCVLPPAHPAPVYRVAEDDITRDTHMDELNTLTAELVSLLQSRAGIRIRHRL